jgi:hypothetical protein
MTNTQLLERQAIDRRVKAIRQRQLRLAKLSIPEAKRESLRFLIEAGIVTKNGKLASNYR